MTIANRRCCGIDVHKKSVTGHVLPQGQANGKSLEREFRTFSRDLRSLRGWLKHCCVTDVVMESTGQYWRAVWAHHREHRMVDAGVEHLNPLQ